MKNILTPLAASIIWALGFPAAQAQDQTLTWNWMNNVCSDMLNCQTGCSSCNQPSGVSDGFHGTGAAWIGLGTCPHPVSSGDNAVLSTGWMPGPDPLKRVLLSGIMTSPMSLDSVIIRHCAFDQGPTWLRISLKRDLSQVATVIYEGPIGSAFANLALSDLGTVNIPEGSTTGGFQLQFQAYGSDGGSWALDRVRVVASPVATDITTGVIGISGVPAEKAGPFYDVLGRPAGKNTVLGISRDGKRRVVIE